MVNDTERLYLHTSLFYAHLQSAHKKPKMKHLKYCKKKKTFFSVTFTNQLNACDKEDEHGVSRAIASILSGTYG